MKNFTIKSLLLFLLLTALLPADGLLMPENEDYPGDLLRNKVTEVTVTINGLVAETIVYQEFVNEWDREIDGVYSFPLPENARSTCLKYARNDSIFHAVLKVQQQSTNPGTGEGGTAALVNAYIGDNGLKLALKKIPAGGIQKVELHYISLLDYHQGTCRYSYPLATNDFIDYPLDHLEFNVTVESSQNINDCEITSHSGYEILSQGPHKAHVRLRKPMAFPAKDLIFDYQADSEETDVDFFSCMDTSKGGHFSLFVRPESESDTSRILPKNIVFLVGNSSRMVGYKLEQSIASISEALDALNADDRFNIILFNSSTTAWQTLPVQAVSANITNAKTFLENVHGEYGSHLDLGINAAMYQFKSDSTANSIIAFTDGYSPLDPVAIAENNDRHAGIFPIGIGDDIDRSRLEMTAALNYGFATFFSEDDDLKSGMNEIIETISRPIVKNTDLTFNKEDVSRIIPPSFPALFAGSSFFAGGKFSLPGSASIDLSGEDTEGSLLYNYQVDFSDTMTNTFTQSLWAKEMIDAIEREIAVYGETESLKDSVIALSLDYQIRCRYTAYIADYTSTNGSWDTDIRDRDLMLPDSYIMSNYPNPFNPSTTIRFYLGNASASRIKFLKIYNLMGQLVHVIDITNLTSGWHEIIFNGKDLAGNSLAGGIYLINLEIDHKPVSTIKVNYLK